ncbi:MAG TPA: hypothetical protein VFR61_06785 [Nitrososphaeraceae archaeon]|nr:hypothetical protein [Nitrososphaeraceae archaeon]
MVSTRPRSNDYIQFYLSASLFCSPPENMMTVDPTLQPENVTASVGDLIIVVFSSGSSMRIPEPDKAAMEVSWAGGGNYRGVTNISDFGTVMVESGAMVYREVMVKE